MRLTVAERVRNHRKKIKENAEKHAAHKEKDRLRKRESRKKAVDPRKANIFSDPVTVPQFISGPFEIPELPAVEKLFKVIRKHKKV